MNESRCFADSPAFTVHQSFNRNGKALRGSKKSVLFYTTDCGDDKEDLGFKLQQRSVSLTALHTGAGSQQQLLEPRMAQLETLEAKMASIEVSLSTTPRRKKGGSVSGGIASPAGHRNRDHYKELDALRIALRDKENIIQTLKGQLCNSLTNRLALRNGAPPLTEADRKATEERLQRLRRDADNKRLAIKNLKLALERLDITDNIDVRIQQAELEYRLGREELELLTLREESRALQAALELAESQEKQKNDTIFSCISGSTQVTIHAVEVSADPKSPRFGAGPREDTPGLYVDWAVEDSGLCKGDRILEVNGKLVVGAGRGDLARLLAVAPDAAQIVVLRKGESLAALRTLRSDNLRLTHRIGYLEEQVRDLLAPSRPEIPADPPPSHQEQVQVFQKGPQVTALVANLPDLNVRNSMELRQSLPTIRHRNSDQPKRLMDPKNLKEVDASPDNIINNHNKSRNRQKQQGFHMTGSTTSLDCKQAQMQSQLQRRRPSRIESAIENLSKNRRSSSQTQSLDFDSEPTYYRFQGTLKGTIYQEQPTTSENIKERIIAACADMKPEIIEIALHTICRFSAHEMYHNGRAPYRTFIAVINVIIYKFKFMVEFLLPLKSEMSLKDTQSRASENSDVSMVYNSQDMKSRPAPPKKPLRLSLHRAASLQSVESAPPASHYDIAKKATKRNHKGESPSEKILRGNASVEETSNQTQESQYNPPQPPSRTPSRAESCQSALRWPSPKPRPHLAPVTMEKWC